MAEIEMNTGHVASPSVAPEVSPVPSAAPAPVEPAKAPEAAPSAPSAPSAPDSGRLTVEKLALRAKKSALAPEKTPEAKEKTPSPAASEKTPAELKKYEFSKKFSALSKEYELPEWAAAYVKDADTEREVKDVFEKAMGLEHVKQRGKELHEKYQSLDQAHKEITTGISELRGVYADAVKSGNLLGLDDFFKRLDIPKEIILQYALQTVDFSQLRPDQQQAALGQVEAQRQSRLLASQNQQLSTTQEQAQVRALSQELNSVLARPDIAPLIKTYESAPGRSPGDFWKRVKDYGEFVYFKTQKLLSPEEAVKAVVAEYGLSLPASPQENAPGAQAQPPASLPPVKAAPAPHRDVPVIPMIQGKSGSPLASKPKSIDDLKKLYKSMNK